jgi:bifunctional N-acetylglucosamine-1-phosphate-uridyltransferase/glucosamine-1-phosphate-acetyltransferase GlmU-like protein
VTQDTTVKPAVVVLAAGRGRRMGSAGPKVLEPLNGRPMLAYVFSALEAAGLTPQSSAMVLVIGHHGEAVRSFAGSTYTFVDQENQLGTGHAVRLALQSVPDDAEPVLVVNGDEPLLDPADLQAMLAVFRARSPAVVLLTGTVRDTRSLGRVIRDESGQVVDLLQESDLNPRQLAITEVNLGAYVFRSAFLRRTIEELMPHQTGEYYVTDLVAAAARQGYEVYAVEPAEADECLGVNTPEELVHAERLLARRAAAV